MRTFCMRKAAVNLLTMFSVTNAGILHDSVLKNFVVTPFNTYTNIFVYAVFLSTKLWPTDSISVHCIETVTVPTCHLPTV